MSLIKSTSDCSEEEKHEHFDESKHEQFAMSIKFQPLKSAGYNTTKAYNGDTMLHKVPIHITTFSQDCEIAKNCRVTELMSSEEIKEVIKQNEDAIKSLSMDPIQSEKVKLQINESKRQIWIAKGRVEEHKDY